MVTKTYNHGVLYSLNFLPWVAIMTLLLVMVYVFPSGNKQPGYVFVSALSAWCCFLWLREKRKVAEKVVVDEESIVASGSFTKHTYIHWKDVDLLMRTGRGLYFVSGKMEKFLYAEIISKEEKIVIRRDIPKFDELIKLIENRTEKTFEPT